MSDMKTSTPVASDPLFARMFEAGAHYGFSKSRRHPSVKPLIFGSKNKMEIFDLEKTKDYLEKAKKFVASVAEKNGTLLFVAGKNEAREIVEKAAKAIGMPYVAGRWIGGTFTNFVQIRKRIDRMETLMSEREKGELTKYTKKERLLIDREIVNLERFFGGIAIMKELPKAMFVVDSKREYTAIAEAKQLGIPVIALSGSDCDMSDAEYPIPGNDSSIKSVAFFVNEIASAYKLSRKAVEK